MIDIVVKHDFNTARYEFYIKNMSSFEDTEENKLEHTNIHKDYIVIMEQYIEVKLKENNSPEAIQAFYADFVKNFKAYEAIHADAVDILFGQVDFAKFKAEILLFKKGMSGEYKADDSDSTASDEDSIMKVPEFVNGLDEFKKANEEDVEDPANGWIKKLDATDPNGRWSFIMW